MQDNPQMVPLKYLQRQSVDLLKIIQKHLQRIK